MTSADVVAILRRCRGRLPATPALCVGLLGGVITAVCLCDELASPTPFGRLARAVAPPKPPEPRATATGKLEVHILIRYRPAPRKVRVCGWTLYEYERDAWWIPIRVPLSLVAGGVHAALVAFVVGRLLGRARTPDDPDWSGAPAARPVGASDNSQA